MTYNTIEHDGEIRIAPVEETADREKRSRYSAAFFDFIKHFYAVFPNGA